MIALLPSSIHWRLSGNGPPEVAIPGRPRWFLVTPVGRAQMGLEEMHSVGTLTGPFALKDGGVLAFSQMLILRFPDSEAGSLDVVARGAAVTETLRRLRQASGQASMPLDAMATVTPQPAPNYDASVRLDGATIPGASFRTDLLDTAVTPASLEVFSACSAEPRIHVDVMLDAVHALVEGDIRKAILYSAIAVESLARASAAEGYDKIIASPATPRHRVVDIPTAGGSVVRKDPIFENLGDDFVDYLHVRPLYLSGRSLQLEEPETYRRTMMLKNTRNGLAHVGNSEPDSRCLPLTREGANDALRTAADVLRWLGDDHRYVIPGGGMRDA
ncbi:MAG TPA: hypothetical protein VGG39_37135 [Polyangiaceae bacterium]